MIELKERGFIGNGELRLLVGLVVQFEGLGGVRIILLGLLFDFVRAAFQSSQGVSFFLFRIWRRRLSKPRKLCHFFSYSREASGS